MLKYSFNILVNALGIKDSGGISAFVKTLRELSGREGYRYIVVCNKEKNIEYVIKNYNNDDSFLFIFVPSYGAVYRLLYENFYFKKIIYKYNVGLVYNFSGIAQLSLPVPQLVKVHNLLLYCTKLDRYYFKHNLYFDWLTKIFIKRMVFLFLLKKADYFEMQSDHVINHLADFINLKSKKVFIKSDIDISSELINLPKDYDFFNKINILYIVGPHFNSPHKNFLDFVNAMTTLKESGIEFEISITLTKKQLKESCLWDDSLNNITNFLGYIENNDELYRQFTNNTILISTSIVETLGLHVIEAIQHGCVAIVPSEKYSFTVYGPDIYTYNLYDIKDLFLSIMNVVTSKDPEDIKLNVNKTISYLNKKERQKIDDIVDIFNIIKTYKNTL
jgi:glycosyltransferase involved in cell wall biosynthesis